MILINVLNSISFFNLIFIIFDCLLNILFSVVKMIGVDVYNVFVIRMVNIFKKFIYFFFLFMCVSVYFNI